MSKEQVSELEKSTIINFMIGVLIPFVVNMSLAFTMLAALKGMTKPNKKLTNQLRQFMKDGNPWNVYIFKDELPNAFVIMGKSVFLTSGLLKIMTERETMAIMLHEISHLKNYDVVKSAAQSSVLTGLLYSVVAKKVGEFYMDEIWLFLLIGIKVFSEIFVGRTYGRKAENRADSYAVQFGYGDDLVSALKKLDKLVQKIIAKEREKYPCGKLCQLSEKIDEFLDEHPPMKKRIETILKKKETWQQAARKNFAGMRNYLMKAFGVKNPKKIKGKVI